MEFAFIFTKINILIVILAICSPCKFIQSPMDFGSSNLLQTTNTSSIDFGRIIFSPPSAVLRPQSADDISLLLTFLSSSSLSKVTVAARGAGHSIHAQSQALDGIVIEMDSLPSDIYIRKKSDDGHGFSYADVSGGALWVELLEESLKFGLAPRSWTDYLYLSIGGTLSNGGISGQTFKYGPQISNVLELDVVTGKGDLVTCSPTKSSELFFAVLGGLGQFGIITRARILLQDAPSKVKWVRVFYDDFDIFIKDQELLVSMLELVDSLEGFVVPNEESLLSSSIAFPAHLHSVPSFHLSKVYYCIEFAVHDFQVEPSVVEQNVEKITTQMSYLQPYIYSVEVSYFDFLNRVRMEEMSLRARGLWEVPHPWLNMFVPKFGIKEFKDLLMDNISLNQFKGPILIYPILKNKWDTNTSAVLPDTEEDLIYIIGVLQSASCSAECLAGIVRRNRRIVEAASAERMGAKQYLAQQPSLLHWRSHFGGEWNRFVARKARFDPLAILGPGQGIFPRVRSLDVHSTLQ